MINSALILPYSSIGSWGSSVGIRTRLQVGRLTNRCSIPCEGKGFFSGLKRLDQLWGGREADHLPLFGA